MRKMTRAEIARRTGLSESLISRVFSGQRKPSVETLIKIRKVMRISMRTLLRELKLDD